PTIRNTQARRADLTRRDCNAPNISTHCNVQPRHRYHCLMSEGSEETSEATQATHRASESQYQPPQPVKIDQGGLSRWLPLAALLIAVVAVALSVWALTNKSSVDSPASANLPGDPKTRVCTAFNLVSQAVQVNTNLNLGP